MKPFTINLFLRFLIFILLPQLAYAENVTAIHIKDFSDPQHDYTIRNAFFSPDGQKIWIALDENERSSSKLINKKIWRVNSSGAIESDSIYSEIKSKYLDNASQDFGVEFVAEDSRGYVYLIKEESGYLIVRDGLPIIRLDGFKSFHKPVFEKLLVLDKGYLLLGSSEGKGSALKIGLDGAIEWEHYYESNILIHDGLFAKDGSLHP